MRCRRCSSWLFQPPSEDGVPDSQPIEQRAYAGDACIYDGENGRCSAAGALLETHTKTHNTISLLRRRACANRCRVLYRGAELAGSGALRAVWRRASGSGGRGTVRHASPSLCAHTMTHSRALPKNEPPPPPSGTFFWGGGGGPPRYILKNRLYDEAPRS